MGRLSVAVLARLGPPARPLFVACYRRASPRFVTVERLLGDGAIGTVHAVAVHASAPAVIDDGADLPWRARPEISGGGHFVDLPAIPWTFWTTSSARCPG